MSKVQSVRFDTAFYDTDQARAWLKSHEYRPIKRVDKTEHWLRYRILKVVKGAKYRITRIGDGIQMVIKIEKD